VDTTRLSRLRYLERQFSRRLRPPVARELSSHRLAPKLCELLDTHEQHARELDRLLQREGHQGDPVPTTFEHSVSSHLQPVGQARTQEAVLHALFLAERWALCQYEVALENAPERTREALGRLLGEQRRQVDALTPATSGR